MDAAMHGHAEVIKLLLEAGAIAIKTKEVSSSFKAKVSLLDDTISCTQLFIYTCIIIIAVWFIVLTAGHQRIHTPYHGIR